MRGSPTFYRANYSLILTTCERRLSDRKAAEDATAEVFRVAWERATAGQELSLPWLYGVARNLVGREYRRTRRIPTQFLEAPTTGSRGLRLVGSRPRGARRALRTEARRTRAAVHGVLGRPVPGGDGRDPRMQRADPLGAPQSGAQRAPPETRRSGRTEGGEREWLTSTTSCATRTRSRPAVSSPLSARAERELAELLAAPAEPAAAPRRRALPAIGFAAAASIAVIVAVVFAVTNLGQPGPASVAAPPLLVTTPLGDDLDDVLAGAGRTSASADGSLDADADDPVGDLVGADRRRLPGLVVLRAAGRDREDLGSRPLGLLAVVGRRGPLRHSPLRTTSRSTRARSCATTSTARVSSRCPTPKRRPDDAVELDAYLRSAGGLRDRPEAIDYFWAIEGMRFEWTLTGPQTAAALDLLAGLPDVTLAGTVTDRLGREGIAIETERASGTHRMLLIFSPETGLLLSSETVYLGGIPDLRPRVPDRPELLRLEGLTVKRTPLLAAAVLVLVSLAPAPASAAVAPPDAESLQARVDAVMLAIPDGVQIADDSIAWEDGAIVMTLEGGSNAAVDRHLRDRQLLRVERDRLQRQQAVVHGLLGRRNVEQPGAARNERPIARERSHERHRQGEERRHRWSGHIAANTGVPIEHRRP